MEFGVRKGFTEVTAQLSRGLSGEEKGRVSTPPAKVFSGVDEDLGGQSRFQKSGKADKPEHRETSVKFISL